MTEKFVLDKTEILDRLGGDEEIFTMMAELFLGDIDGHVMALDAALSAGDGVALSREAHTIKGLLATFSDDLGAETAFNIEQQARTGDFNGLPEKVLNLQARFKMLAEVLQQTLGLAEPGG